MELATWVMNILEIADRYLVYSYYLDYIGTLAAL